jgi:hypothetical protein
MSLGGAGEVNRMEKEMRLIRTFGIAAALVVVATAFLTASAAMAETSALCNSNESGQEVCAAGNQLGKLHYVAPEIKILNELQNVTCESLFEGNAFGLFTNAPVKIVGKFIYTNCNGSCTVVQLTEGELKLLKTTATEGTMTGTGIKVEVACLFIKCVYTWEGLSAGATSANLPTTAGKFLITAQELKKTEGKTCPTTTKLDMLMESLTDVYIKK